MKRIVGLAMLPLLICSLAFAQGKAAEKKAPEKAKTTEKAPELVGSKSSKIYHTATCKAAQRIDAKNKVTFKDADEAAAAGYAPCKMCKPPAGKAPEKAPEKKAPEKKQPEGKK